MDGTYLRRMGLIASKYNTLVNVLDCRDYTLQTPWTDSNFATVEFPVTPSAAYFAFLDGLLDFLARTT